MTKQKLSLVIMKLLFYSMIHNDKIHSKILITKEDKKIRCISLIHFIILNFL